MREGADIARGEDVGILCPEGRIDDDAAIDRKTGGRGKSGARRGADADQDRVGLDDAAVRQGELEAVPRKSDLLQSCPEPDLDAGCGVMRLQEGRDGCRNHPAEEPRQQLDHDRPAPRRDGARGDLEANEAAADDGDLGARATSLPQPIRIGQIAQIEDLLGDGGLKRQPARLAAGREQQLGVADLLAVREAHGLAPAIDRRDHAVGMELDAGGRERVGLGEGEVVRRALAGEVGLGQGRPLVGWAGLGAEQDDRAVMALLAQDQRGAAAGLTGTDDHHRLIAHDPPPLPCAGGQAAPAVASSPRAGVALCGSWRRTKWVGSPSWRSTAGTISLYAAQMLG